MQRLSILLLPLLVIACSSDQKPEAPPLDLLTEIVATANGSGATTIEARLKVKEEFKREKDLEIELPYKIMANVGGKQQWLTRVDSPEGPYYTTKFESDSIKDQYVVSVQGKAQDQKQAQTVIRLPEPFTITSASDLAYDRNQNIKITWDSPHEQGKLKAGFALSCQGDKDASAVLFSKTIPDAGEFVINAAEIVNHPKLDVDTKSGCDAMVILSRSNEAKLDPAYGKGSYSLGVQQRITHFSIKGVATL